MSRAASSGAPPLTDLLIAWGHGDKVAFERLMPLVHKELRRLAQWHVAGERIGHTLQATALVNEAYLRLININRVDWLDRAHFFAMAARQMRRILIDSARKRKNQKRGGGIGKVSLAEGLVIPDRAEDLVALDDALDALATIDKRRGKVVELKFFGGLSVDEMAQVLGVSSDTVKRDWKLAKAWLGRELRRTRIEPRRPGTYV